MEGIKLGYLIDNLDYVELVNCDNLDLDITGISYNSKKTKQNDIFV